MTRHFERKSVFSKGILFLLQIRVFLSPVGLFHTWNTLPNYCFCPESWILQGSAPSLILNDTVFTCTVYKFHFIASKYVQVFMRTPKKKWQNSRPVLEGFRTRGRDSTVRQGVPFLDRSRIEWILTCCGLAWWNVQCLLIVVSGGSFIWYKLAMFTITDKDIALLVHVTYLILKSYGKK
jgi:hypothetical protein